MKNNRVLKVLLPIFFLVFLSSSIFKEDAFACSIAPPNILLLNQYHVDSIVSGKIIAVDTSKPEYVEDGYTILDYTVEIDPTEIIKGASQNSLLQRRYIAYERPSDRTSMCSGLAGLYDDVYGVDVELKMDTLYLFGFNNDGEIMFTLEFTDDLTLVRGYPSMHTRTSRYGDLVEGTQYSDVIDLLSMTESEYFYYVRSNVYSLEDLEALAEEDAVDEVEVNDKDDEIVQESTSISTSASDLAIWGGLFMVGIVSGIVIAVVLRKKKRKKY